jgi:hypothetical protein
LVLDVPLIRTGQVATNPGVVLSMFSYRMTQIEVEQLQVALKPVGTPTSGCEVTVFGDLRRGLRKNWVVDKWIAGVAALGGGALGTAIGLAALSLGTLAAVPAAAGAVILGGISLGGYRWTYRHALREARKELEELLAAVEGNLRAASVFGTLPGAPSPPPHLPGGSDSGTLLTML